MNLLRVAFLCFVLAGIGLLVPIHAVRALADVFALLFVLLLAAGLATVERAGRSAAIRGPRRRRATAVWPVP